MKFWQEFEGKARTHYPFLPLSPHPPIALPQMTSGLDGLPVASSAVLEATLPLTAAYDPAMVTTCVRLAGATWTSDGRRGGGEGVMWWVNPTVLVAVEWVVCF